MIVEYLGIEYDDTKDLLRCPACSEWSESLAAHAQVHHGMSASAFRSAHKIPPSSKLRNIRLRQTGRSDYFGKAVNG